MAPNVDLEVELLVGEEASVSAAFEGSLTLEVDLGNTVANTTFDNIEMIEVTLPPELNLEKIIHNGGGVPGIVVIESTETEPPPGTPVGYLVLKKQ